MASVAAKNVVKRYGSINVLKGVSLNVPDGEFVVLVGPSGCGKSTLLRMIAGLEEISEGEISIGGEIVNDFLPKERNIAMVFQSYALYPHMSVHENMSFSLKLKGSSKNEIDQKVGRAAQILGLEKLLHRRPRELSGGQRQRVAMGRAIVRDPQVFLFDEPLSNLDASLRVQMRSEIKELHERLGTTMIYVTHDQIEAMTLADRIVVMRDGLIEQIGTPLELYDSPNNRFVAGFIGSPAMNFISGEMTEGGFQTSSGIFLPCDTSKRSAVTYGIRPEHMHLGQEGVEVKVSLIEPTGAETQVAAHLGNDPITGVFRGRVSAQRGTVMRVMPDPECVHLFDSAGKRV
ncbi:MULTISPECIES: sn-glycerol-3-phosphate ABC transporter ATP-binding protein UgpC [unclassified Mesorhizobium]|uniref:ABC transporter ATP-binding protein n=1 Tax=unclassified Mesorhizobium TaxID=325217 RepID=UPI000FD83D84|nr:MULTISPECIES: sn-glycerol-3-phosphate ABC transporter ATP-binding protein UgpC [unclassified Mesorhizobium]TGT71934.1 sn-glycerol-3-phosphate ABC transporter ATP-binding protein UgpC [Mesorhizobium sp. M2E.F.Ca.ET.166.01.1.1]TGV99351.1 sn-glycerol-3-phosphate ABC transporter ATP-binding protein UgpC [Mesorhizobium sp. M2E.F.Ca.ET.154.01.1.1]